MEQAAQHLVGKHDFVCFQTAGSERESTVRTIFSAQVRGMGGTPKSAQGVVDVSPSSPRPAEDLGRATQTEMRGADEANAVVAIEVTGDGFLYTMVRTIVGTLVEVGRGKRDPSWVAEVIASRDRTRAGQTAPPHGLMLMQVEY
jgi:tRNA pseudouridine38-40 synthase